MKEKRGSFKTGSVVRLILGAKNILRRYSTVLRVRLLSFVCSTEGKGSQPRLWNIPNLGAVLRNKSCAACETNITLVATIIDPSLAQKSCMHRPTSHPRKLLSTYTSTAGIAPATTSHIPCYRSSTPRKYFPVETTNVPGNDNILGSKFRHTKLSRLDDGSSLLLYIHGHPYCERKSKPPPQSTSNHPRKISRTSIP